MLTLCHQIPELLEGFLLNAIVVQVRETLHSPAHKPQGGVAGGVEQRGTQIVGLQSQDLAHHADQKLLLKDREDLQFFSAWGQP